MRRFSHAPALACALLFPIAAACADPSAAVTSCSVLTIQATAGTTPTFSWDAACPVSALQVALAGPGPILWGAISPDQSNSIPAPVVYGGTPTGAAMTANMVQFLVKGTTYQITLYRVDAGGMPRPVGAKAFTP
jgi:hypothetical protein